jgi:hypothetical protein
MAKMTLAICADATAIPVKPKTPATIATIKNINTHCNINNPFIKFLIPIIIVYYYTLLYNPSARKRSNRLNSRGICMKRIFLTFLACSCIFLTGCAASDAAQEDNDESIHKIPPKPMAPPVNNGSAVAAKMISPVIGY